MFPILQPPLILNRHIIRPPNPSHRNPLPLPQLIPSQNTLLTLLRLDIGNGNIILPRRRPFTPIERGCVVLTTAGLVPAALAVGGVQGPFSENEFQEWLQGWNAGGYNHDVGFDAGFVFG